jgi:hypothetical protein
LNTQNRILVTADTEYEWVTRQLLAKPKLPLRAFITVGLLETLPKPGNTNQVEVNRHFREALKGKGYEIIFVAASCFLLAT